MAAVAHVFTIARVAALLGEDEDWLHEISISMMPEDGLVAVYGTGDDYTPAFTEQGVETLRELVEIHKAEKNQSANQRS